MTLILGSTSRSRIELFKGLGLDFRTVNPNFDERSYAYLGDPIQYCSILSLKKNQAIPKTNPLDLVITCDTIVFFEGQILNKPLDYLDAKQMLQKLSGKKHQVLSGITISKDHEYLTSCEITDVTFHPLTVKQIELFLKDPHFIHRSGSYTLSGRGALLIKSLDGSYENVIGVPFNTLENLLNKWNLSLWDLCG
jgi:septum formation protein